MRACHRAIRLLLPALAAGLMAPVPALAQGPGAPAAPGIGVDEAPRSPTRARDRDLRLPAPLLRTEGPYVLVHLAENRVFLMQEGRPLWSAPAGTGTGFRLDGAGKRWTFSTPRGLFKVRRKEKDPLWEAPDWFYVEQGVPVPPDNDPARLMEGVMGSTALLLGDGIAIHGTNRPELILHPDPDERRVSHGCIRLTNEAARDLYHRVEVGTPVLVF